LLTRSVTHLVQASVLEGTAQVVAVMIMSYGNVIVTIRCKIQLVEIILFSLRQTTTVMKTAEAATSIASDVAMALYATCYS